MEVSETGLFQPTALTNIHFQETPHFHVSHECPHFSGTQVLIGFAFPPDTSFFPSVFLKIHLSFPRCIFFSKYSSLFSPKDISKCCYSNIKRTLNEKRRKFVSNLASLRHPTGFRHPLFLRALFATRFHHKPASFPT